MTDSTRNLLEQHFDTAFAAPDGIARLRELILTLAMQGKLVEQDPNDPPASELLKEIGREKASHEGTKTRKKQNLPPIKPEEVPYELPQGWEWVRLGEVTNIIRGITFPASEKTCEPAPNRIACLRTKNVQNNIEWDDLLFIDSEYMKKDEQIIEKKDIVMSMANSRELVGKVAIVEEIPVERSTFGGFLGVIRTYSIDARYLLSILRTTYSRKSLIDSASQTTNIANISLGKLNPFLIPLSPLPEQHRIVTRINQLMARCDTLEKLRKEREAKRLAVHAAAIKQLLDPSLAPSRLRVSQASSNLRAFVPACEPFAFLAQHFGELYTVKENIAELRKAILQLAVMGRLVPQDPNDPPASELLKEIEAEKQRLSSSSSPRRRGSSKPLPPIKPEEVPYQLPQGWEWVRLGEIAEFINGDRGKNYPNREEYVSEGIPWINTGHIEPNGSLTRRDMHFITREKFESLNGGKIQLDDLVYCLRGATFGKTAIVDSYAEGAIASSLMIIRPYAPISNRYMYQYLIGPTGRSQIFRFDNGSAQPNLSANSVRLYVYPLPSLPEQHRIVARIDQLMALCDTLDQQIDAATGKQTELLNAVMGAV